jgi:hypothetical protein
VSSGSHLTRHTPVVSDFNILVSLFSKGEQPSSSFASYLTFCVLISHPMKENYCDLAYGNKSR